MELKEEEKYCKYFLTPISNNKLISIGGPVDKIISFLVIWLIKIGAYDVHLS